jgi:hypothetical protein
MRKHGQTDMTKLVVAFRNFAKAPKIYAFSIYKGKGHQKNNREKYSTKMKCNFKSHNFNVFVIGTKSITYS